MDRLFVSAEMSGFLKTSELTKPRAFDQEVEIKFGRAAIIYSTPTPDYSLTRGTDSAEIAQTSEFAVQRVSWWAGWDSNATQLHFRSTALTTEKYRPTFEHKRCIDQMTIDWIHAKPQYSLVSARSTVMSQVVSLLKVNAFCRQRNDGQSGQRYPGT